GGADRDRPASPCRPEGTGPKLSRGAARGGRRRRPGPRQAGRQLAAPLRLPPGPAGTARPAARRGGLDLGAEIAVRALRRPVLTPGLRAALGPVPRGGPAPPEHLVRPRRPAGPRLAGGRPAARPDAAAARGGLAGGPGRGRLDHRGSG